MAITRIQRCPDGQHVWSANWVWYLDQGQTHPFYTQKCEVCGELKLKDSTPKDPSVDHPPHYNAGNIEVIDAIDDWQLGFYEGNVVKYVARARHKGKELEDLQKALWYLTRRVEHLKKGE